jgi:hypothetical protein
MKEKIKSTNEFLTRLFNNIQLTYKHHHHHYNIKDRLLSIQGLFVLVVFAIGLVIMSEMMKNHYLKTPITSLQSATTTTATSTGTDDEVKTPEAGSKTLTQEAELLRSEDSVLQYVDRKRHPLPLLLRIFNQKHNMSKSFDAVTEEFDRYRKEINKYVFDESDKQPQYEQPLPHPKFSMTINVITFNRPKSLKRLCESLVNAKYYGHTIHIHFYVDQGADLDTKRFVKDFVWPHGVKRSLFRYVSSGLVRAVIESWYPSHPHDYVMLAEDDIEVSKYWYYWVLRTMKEYRYPYRDSQGKIQMLDPSIFGLSLYTPRESEMSNPRFRYFPDKHFSQQVWIHSIPCSWGAVYYPEHWLFFRQYIEMRRNLGKNLHIPECECNGWRESWVKFYTELGYMKGWYMLYPNFPNQTSFSTNHLEPGVHVVKDEELHMKDLFTVPLAVTNIIPDKLPSVDTLPILDYRYKRIKQRKDLIEQGYFTWQKFIQELSGHENYNKRW